MCDYREIVRRLERWEKDMVDMYRNHGNGD